MKFKVARAGIHLFEEPIISGDKGSGTIFFSGCTMRCVYCQNYEISHKGKGLLIDDDQLIALMLDLQEQGVHNINLVTPSHYAKQLAKLLPKIKGKQLTIPIVYNTSSYEKVETLQLLDGLIDIYLPDLKYCDENISIKYSNAPNYYVIATAAIAEMRRQQPNDVIIDDIMRKGVIVRHLALPGLTEDSKKVLDHLAQLDISLYISIMGQYFPTQNVSDIKELNRRLRKREYNDLIEYFHNVGLCNGFLQDLSSAIEDYVPDFDLEILKAKINSLKLIKY